MGVRDTKSPSVPSPSSLNSLFCSIIESRTLDTYVHIYQLAFKRIGCESQSYHYRSSRSRFDLLAFSLVNSFGQSTAINQSCRTCLILRKSPHHFLKPNPNYSFSVLKLPQCPHPPATRPMTNRLHNSNVVPQYPGY